MVAFSWRINIPFNLLSHIDSMISNKYIIDSDAIDHIILSLNLLYKTCIPSRSKINSFGCSFCAFILCQSIISQQDD